MTPLPKKRHAKARSRTRKAAIKYKLPDLVTCPNCQSLKLTHRTCLKCGYYGPLKTEKTASK
jgi:large subunit ribosomal protein L32